jgi:DNA-binding NtrC family response regulator
MAETARILIVDDDPIVAESLGEHLAGEGYETATAMNAAEAKALLDGASNFPTPEGRAPKPVHVVLSDVSMPGESGVELLRWIKEQHPTTAVVMLTGYGTIESAVEALRLGAADYLTKPVMDDELRVALERALRQQALMAENRTLKRALDDRFGLDNIVGSDHRMRKVFELIEAVAPSRTTVLMSGESGTGKSLIAHAIHQRSTAREQALRRVERAARSPRRCSRASCSGTPRARSRARTRTRSGKFVAADGGTLFLDEINSARARGCSSSCSGRCRSASLSRWAATQTIEVDVRVSAGEQRTAGRARGPGASSGRTCTTGSTS